LEKINTYFKIGLGKYNSSYIFKQLRKGRFLVNNMIWNLFLQTGNVETYLLLKQLENEQLDETLLTEYQEDEEIATLQTKM